MSHRTLCNIVIFTLAFAVGYHIRGDHTHAIGAPERQGPERQHREPRSIVNTGRPPQLSQHHDLIVKTSALVWFRSRCDHFWFQGRTEFERCLLKLKSRDVASS
jgi:hypothetical protein